MAISFRKCVGVCSMLALIGSATAANAATSVQTLWDMNGDGVEEVGQFGFNNSTNEPELVALDPTTGLTVATYTWTEADSAADPMALYSAKLKVISDRTGDGVPEVAVYGYTHSEHPILVIKDGTNPNNLVDVFHWMGGDPDSKFHELGDLTGDGTTELAILTTRFAGDMALLYVHDGANPNGTEQTFTWQDDYASEHTLVQLSDMNGDGIQELGLYAQSAVSQNYVLEILSGADSSVTVNVVTWSPSWH